MRPAAEGARGGPSFAQALALGALQGPTELLPVSSSAHTRLAPWLAGWSYCELDPSLRKSLEAALHVGAAVAMTLEMRGELAEAARTLTARKASAIALALAPPILAGYTLEHPIERRLGGPRSIAAGLIAGAVAMALADTHPRARRLHSNSRDPHATAAPHTSRAAAGGRSEQDAGPLDGLALGIAQAAALMPGVSRNGATLTAARARGFARADAQALSWHVALPVMFGAGVLKGWRLLRRGAEGGAGAQWSKTVMEPEPREAEAARMTKAAAAGPPTGVWAALALGAGGAFASTWISARLLRRPCVSGRSLVPWAVYRCALAVLALVRAGRDAGGAQNMKR